MKGTYEGHSVEYVRADTGFQVVGHPDDEAKPAGDWAEPFVRGVTHMGTRGSYPATRRVSLKIAEKYTDPATGRIDIPKEREWTRPVE